MSKVYSHCVNYATYLLNITASLGVAEQDENTPDLETLISRADQAMYTAKRKGRNQVAMSS